MFVPQPAAPRRKVFHHKGTKSLRKHNAFILNDDTLYSCKELHIGTTLVDMFFPVDVNRCELIGLVKYAGPVFL